MWLVCYERDFKRERLKKGKKGSIWVWAPDVVAVCFDDWLQRQPRGLGPETKRESYAGSEYTPSVGWGEKTHTSHFHPQHQKGTWRPISFTRLITDCPLCPLTKPITHVAATCTGCQFGWADDKMRASTGGYRATVSTSHVDTKNVAATLHSVRTGQHIYIECWWQPYLFLAVLQQLVNEAGKFVCAHRQLHLFLLNESHLLWYRQQVASAPVHGPLPFLVGHLLRLELWSKPVEQARCCMWAEYRSNSAV